MKGLRKAALGLAMVGCLLTAVPAVQAGPMDTPLVLTSQGAWIGGWVARIARWLGLSDSTGGVDANGGPGWPAPQADCTGSIDPNGGCRP